MPLLSFSAIPCVLMNGSSSDDVDLPRSMVSDQLRCEARHRRADHDHPAPSASRPPCQAPRDTAIPSRHAAQSCDADRAALRRRRNSSWPSSRLTIKTRQRWKTCSPVKRTIKHRSKDLRHSAARICPTPPCPVFTSPNHGRCRSQPRASSIVSSSPTSHSQIFIVVSRWCCIVYLFRLRLRRLRTSESIRGESKTKVDKSPLFSGSLASQSLHHCCLSLPSTRQRHQCECWPRPPAAHWRLPRRVVRRPRRDRAR